MYYRIALGDWLHLGFDRCVHVCVYVCLCVYVCVPALNRIHVYKVGCTYLHEVGDSRVYTHVHKCV